MEITIESKKRQEFIDITPLIKKALEKSNVKDGICNVYAPHATAALIINENADPNIEKDFFKALNSAIPASNNYLHDKIDNNAQAHILSSLLSCSITIPIRENKLALGRWQSIMLVELDGPRERKVIITLIAK